MSYHHEVFQADLAKPLESLTMYNLPVSILVLLSLPSLAFAQKFSAQVTPGQISAMTKQLEIQNPNDLYTSKIQTLGLAAALTDPAVVEMHARPFTKELTQIGAIQDQASSGDCWIFASLNMLRVALIQSGKVAADFAYSNNYLYYYSMVEKTNVYFERLISERPHSINAKKFRKDFSLADDTREYLVTDGGEFPWVRYLISKYGVVPESAMPSTKVTLNDALMLRMLRTQVLVTAKELVTAMSKMGELGPEQLDMLRLIKLRGEKRVVSILNITLGTPPDLAHPFQFATAKEGTKSFTPQSFVEFAGLDLHDYVSIVSSPLQPYGKALKVQNHTSIGVDDHLAPSFELHYVNEQPGRLMEMVKASIDAGSPVYFAADVVPNVSSSGAMDTNLFKVDPFLNPATPTLSLKDQMHSGLVYTDHAMVFVGYESDSSGQVTRFKVENSWGDGVGHDGFFSMSKDWFEIFVNEIDVRSSVVNPTEYNAWMNPHPKSVKNYDDLFGTE